MPSSFSRVDPLLKLAKIGAALDISTQPDAVRQRLSMTLLDSFGVGVAGAQTPEYRSLVRIWPLPGGPASVWGFGTTTDTQTATLLNGVALCSLELDEGNQRARGHPGAHVIPAAVAEAQRLRSSGTQLLSSILAGYEVAARVGSAFTPRRGLHPHGHWGAIGAAMAVGRLNGLNVHELAAAMDAAAALAIASPFSSALDGSFIRNLWVGAAGSHGISAVRIVQAGLGGLNSTMTESFGSILGELDYESIARDPDRQLAITEGYLKRHSSCAYTHAAADAAFVVREKLAGTTSEIDSIRIDTYSLAAPLSETLPKTRLAAMFSLPHVVAVALRSGNVQPKWFEESSLADTELSRLRKVTTIRIDPQIDDRVPQSRGARVTVSLRDGQRVSAEVPNAIGNYAFHPFELVDIHYKLEELLGSSMASTVQQLVGRLEYDSDASLTLTELGSLCFPRELHEGEL